MDPIKVTAEDLVLTTPVIDFMICTDAHLGKDKRRHCFVHKKRSALDVYKQFQDTQGRPVSVVTTPVFEDVVQLLKDAARKIQDLERDLDSCKSQLDAYKMTIETLKKNGVID